MAWTNPRTWVAGELVTAAQLNTHLRDNLTDLDGRATAALVFDNTDGRNLAGTETVLYTYTVPAATFDAIGKTVHLLAVGVFAPTDSFKILRIRVGGLTGSNVIQLNGTTLTNGKTWWAEAYVTKAAVNVQRGFGNGDFIGADLNAKYQFIVNTTHSEAAPIAIVVTGEAPNAQEVVYTSSWVQILG